MFRSEVARRRAHMAALPRCLLLCVWAAAAAVLVCGLRPASPFRTSRRVDCYSSMPRRCKQVRFTSTNLRMAATEANPYYRGLDAYAILGLKRTAAKAEVKVAYRKAVAAHHPDKFPDDEAKKTEGNLRMEKINRAYFCLGDNDRRRRYDKYGESGVGTSAASEHQLKERMKEASPSPSLKEPAQRRGFRTISSDDEEAEAEEEEGEGDVEDIPIPDVDRFTKGAKRGTTSARFRDFVQSSDEARRVAEAYVAGSSKQQQQPRRGKDREDDDPVDMYAEVAEFLRRNANKQSAGGARQPSSSYEEAVEDMNRRSSQYADTAMDSPAMVSLRAQRRQLLAEKERQELLLEADVRDWGDVMDKGQVQARLQAIAEVKAMGDRIFEIDCEIDELLCRSQRSGQQSGGTGGEGERIRKQFYEDFHDDFDYSDGRDDDLRELERRLWSTERRRGRQ